MQVCITQKDGIRYFSRFRNINERDRLVVQLNIEGTRRVYEFDLTEVLLEKFAEHPEIMGQQRKRRRVSDYEAPVLAAKDNKAKNNVTVVSAEPEKASVKKDGARKSADSKPTAEKKRVAAVAEVAGPPLPEEKPAPVRAKTTRPKKAVEVPVAASAPVEKNPTAAKRSRKAPVKAVAVVPEPAAPKKRARKVEPTAAAKSAKPAKAVKAVKSEKVVAEAKPAKKSSEKAVVAAVATAKPRKPSTSARASNGKMAKKLVKA